MTRAGWQKVKNFFKRVGKGISTAASWTWDKIKKGVKFGVNGVKKVLGFVKDNKDSLQTVVQLATVAGKAAAGAG